MIFRNRKQPSGMLSPFGVTGTKSGQPIRESFFGPNVTISGDLYSRGNIEIHGKVEGSITCRNLTLGEDPNVAGEITTESVRICGHFNGNIRAREVILTRTAVVSGEIWHSSLEVEPGAEVQGSVRYLRPDAFPLIEFEGEEPDTEAAAFEDDLSADDPELNGR